MIRNRIAWIFALSPLVAHAVNCTEYFKQSGKTTVAPVVNELTLEETKILAETLKKSETPLRIVSRRPRLFVQGDVFLATFANLDGEGFQVFGLQGPRGYTRPDFQEITGFLRKSDEIAKSADASSEAYQTALLAKSGILKTRGRAILYGKPMTPAVIPLETNEIISAVVNLGPERRLVVTARVDQKIGFVTKASSNQRNFMIEVYVIEPTGYAVVGFRVPAGKRALPKIDVLDMNGKGLLLAADDQTFNLALGAPAPALRP